MRTFVINGRRYNEVEPDFNFFADYGDCLNNPLKSARAYLSFCSGMNENEAGKEINDHMIKGGTLDELATCMTEAFEESGFFRLFKENENKEITEIPEAEEQKKPKRVKA